MGEVALEYRIKLHFFKLNLRFHLEAHKKRLVKSNYNILASFSEFLDLWRTVHFVSSENKRSLVLEERLSPLSLTNIIKKKRGVGTVHRGTPDKTFEGSDYFPLTTTL